MKPSKLGLLGWFFIALFGIGAGSLAFFLLFSLYSVQGSLPPAIVEELLSETAPRIGGDPQEAEEVQQPDRTAEESEQTGELIQAPVFSDVRVEEDGLAVIAGRAEPRRDIVLYVDGQEVARTDADGAGAFAMVTFLPHSDHAQVLTLAWIDEAGAAILSLDEVILAPRPVPAAPDIVASLDVPVAPQDAHETSANVDLAAAQAETQPGRINPSAPPAPSRAANPVLAEDDVRGDARPDAVNQIDANQAGAEEVSSAANALAAAQEQDTPIAAQDLQSNPLHMPSLEQEAETDAATDSARPEIAVHAENQALDDTALPGEDPGLSSANPQDADPKRAAEKTASPVIVLKSNQDGVELLQPPSPSPDIMSQVSLDTIGYSHQGDVQLSGRAQSDAASIRIYLDNAPIAALAVDTSGAWRGRLPNVDTGIYTLRIDEVTSDGTVTSRVETPFKRESPEVLQAASVENDAPVTSITVQTGNTLWAIARERYGEGTFYLRVFEANKDTIKDPNLIYPGQVFTLPQE